jgi:hypothetical protein
MQNIDLFGDDLQVVLAGGLGGVVRWLTLKSGWMDGLSSVIIGSICAKYLGPLCFRLLDPVLGKIIMETDSRVMLSGFLIGVGGIGVSGFIVDVWRLRSTMLTGGHNADHNDTGRDR